MHKLSLKEERAFHTFGCGSARTYWRTYEIKIQCVVDFFLLPVGTTFCLFEIVVMLLCCLFTLALKTSLGLSRDDTSEI